ncbi:MAG: glucokinase [Deltaproteobacteria bacterium]|nr:glucokinase [Deltaproteobacteria bacterium]
MTKQTTAILTGDIGGTKTILAVFSPGSGPRTFMAEATFASRDYSSLEGIVREFLSRVKIKVDLASFGVAGPVVNGQARITNLPWVLDERRLADALGLSRVHLMNDLLALAHAVPLLEPKDLLTLNKGRAVPGGAIAVLAPGTGLGQAYLTWDGTRYLAHPSEGGHADFAPTNALEVRLLLYLLNRFNHVSAERVCSGIGLANIHAFLKEDGQGEVPDWLAEQLIAVRDPVPVIIGAALDKDRPCGLCRETLNTFISILGAESGNLALKMMASGGIYLGGGIPPRILPALQQRLFMEAFGHKGRMSGLMDEFPVHVILNPKMALVGAACHGLWLETGETK